MKGNSGAHEQVLRGLIREYLLTYDLPTSQGPSGVTLPSPGSLPKFVGLFVAGLVALKGYLFIKDSKNALLSFAENITNASTALDSLTDLITREAHQHRSTLTLMSETDDVFNTRYGEIRTATLDKQLISALKTASKAKYVTFPQQVNITSKEALTTSLASVKESLRQKVDNLVSTVTSSTKNYPDNLTGFGINLASIDGITDLDDAEKTRAKSAMTDAVSTAIYNKMKSQMNRFIQDVNDEIVKKRLSESERTAMIEALTNFAVDVAKIMEVTGDARRILAEP